MEEQEYLEKLLDDDRYDPMWITEYITPRENDELNWCLIYQRHGTDGHQKIVLIQKLYDALDAVWRELSDEQREIVKEALVVGP